MVCKRALNYFILFKFQFQLIFDAEKIGGNYFMKYNPETFFERKMTRLNPWID